jgi:hypothetical protein
MADFFDMGLLTACFFDMLLDVVVWLVVFFLWAWAVPAMPMTAMSANVGAIIFAHDPIFICNSKKLKQPFPEWPPGWFAARAIAHHFVTEWTWRNHGTSEPIL